jgi:hypothetical protein
MYFTNVGPKSGPILRASEHDSVPVLPDRDGRTPIGTARRAGSTPNGVVIWEIAVRGAALPGRWIVLGREFVLRQGVGRDEG